MLVLLQQGNLWTDDLGMDSGTFKQERLLTCVFVTRAGNSMWKYIQVLILIFKVKRRHGFSHAFQIFSGQSNQKIIIKLMNSSEYELK